MKKKGKKYQDIIKDIDLNKEYGLDEAIGLVKNTSTTKFDGTVEFHAKLGLDLEKPEQNVRSTVVLPNGTGRDMKILVFAEAKDEKKAKDAGADFVGLDEFIEKIKKGWLGFDVAVATPENMPKIAKLAKILGARGLMPNPKAGTVTTDVVKTIEEFKKGKIEFRADSLGGIHVGIGKVSWDEKKLVENFNTLHKALVSAKPSSLKGVYIKSISLSSTMGPGIKININTLKIVISTVILKLK